MRVNLQAEHRNGETNTRRIEMLVLSRKLGQSIKLSSGGMELELTVIRIAGNRVQVSVFF